MSIGDSMRSGARWAGWARMMGVGLQLASIVVYSRLLSTQDIGLMAMAMVAVNLAYVFRDLGTGAAMIQMKELDDETRLAVFYLNVATGVVLTASLWALAVPVASLFGAQPLDSVMRILAPVFFLASLGLTQQALLERSFRFKALAFVEVGANLAGLAAGMAAAFSGFGVYSLVWQALVTAAATSVALWRVSPWKPTSGAWRHGLSRIARFGAHLTGFNVVNYFSRNADAMIIGRMLGAEALGIYSLAYRIMLFPVQNLTFVVSRVTLPSFSAVQDDRRRLAGMYLHLLSLIALLAAPLMLGLWAVRGEFVDVLLGPRWATVASVIKWLAMVGLIQSLVSTTGSLLIALGQPRKVLHLGVLGLVLLVTSFIAGVNGGIEGVAMAYLFGNVANAAICFHAVLGELKLKVVDLARAVGAPIASAVFMGVCVFYAETLLDGRGISAPVRLAGLVCLGAAIYVPLAWITCRDSVAELFRLLGLKRLALLTQG